MFLKVEPDLILDAFTLLKMKFNSTLSSEWDEVGGGEKDII